jgi:hypothetical protein
LIGKFHNHSSNTLQAVAAPVLARQMIERFWSGKTTAVAGKE